MSVATAEPSADTCGCRAAADTAPPVACTLGPDDVAGRVEEWRALLEGVRRRTSIEGGLRLSFDPDVRATDVATLAAAEQECCAFFGFRITIDDRGLALEVTAPPDGQPLVISLFGTPD